MSKPIILASASPRRAALLKQLGFQFEVVPSYICENVAKVRQSPEKIVMDLAEQKAVQVAQNLSYGLIIGADTVVVMNGQVLGKPDGPDHAFQMLSLLNGREHSVFTGIAIIEVPGLKTSVTFCETQVKFRSLTESELRSYIATGEPFDKAGAYGIQGIGASLVEGIRGCYFNVVGLPLSKLVVLLKEFDNSE